jgi:predicted ATPase
MAAKLTRVPPRRARLLTVARCATVRIRDMTGTVFGQGLWLHLDDSSVVLTCHHVIREIDPDGIRVQVVEPEGSEPLPARLDVERSCPGRDSVVLRIAGLPPPTVNPVLHELDGEVYEGGMRVTGITHRTPDTFAAVLRARTRDLAFEGYTLPVAYPLTTEDSRRGISGGPVWCDGGILGLVHASRDESSSAGREAYMAPLSSWGQGWAELDREIIPFVDSRLLEFADVMSPSSGDLDDKMRLSSRGRDVYSRRDVDDRLDALLRDSNAAVVVGRARSGKTRAARELARQYGDALVVLPKIPPPPDMFERSTWTQRSAVLIFDNLHLTADAAKPLEWFERFRGIAQDVRIIITSQNADEWARLQDGQRALFDQLDAEPVFLSRDEGADLDPVQGWEIAQRMGLSKAEFDAWFDGTPGSLMGGELPPVAPALPPGERQGVALEALPDRDDRPPTNLPRLSSSFVGRERELAELRELLEIERLVTLIGPSGVGKTRLSLRLGRELLEHYRDGVWLTDLSYLEDDALVASTIASRLRIRDTGTVTPTARLLEHLGPKQVLLILNGCDRVAGAVTRTAETLLGECPRLRIVATCRTGLGAGSEHRYELQPLGDLADSAVDSGSVSLFVDRIPGLRDSLAENDLNTVGELVRDLARNPLAIELAATLTANAPIGKVAQALHGRLRRARDVDAADSHVDALTVTVDSVVGELSVEHQRLFARVGVFVASFDMAAVQGVGSAAGIDPDRIPGLLRGLVDRKLVLADARESDEHPRFRLLEAMREHALRTLADIGETDAARRDHAEYFAGLVDQAAGRRGTWSEAVWIERLTDSLENIRDALRWSIDHRENRLALRLGAGIWWYWYQRSAIREGRQWLDELSRLASAHGPATHEDLLDRAEVLNGAGNFHYLLGRYPAAQRLLERSYQIRSSIGAEALAAGSLNNLGLVASRRGKPEEARELFLKAIAISAERGNDFFEAMHFNNLGQLDMEWAGDLDAASTAQARSLMLFARCKSDWGCAMAREQLGRIALMRGDVAAAAEQLGRSSALSDSVGSIEGTARVGNAIGALRRAEGRLKEARDCHRAAAALFQDLGHRAGFVESIEGLALAFAPDRIDKATELIAQADGLRSELQSPRPRIADAEIEALRSGAARGGTRARVGEAGRATQPFESHDEAL